MLHFERIAKDSFDGFVNFFTKKHIKVNKFFTANGSTYIGRWGPPQSTLDYSGLSGQWVSDRNDPVITYTTKCPITSFPRYRNTSEIPEQSRHFLSHKKIT